MPDDIDLEAVVETLQHENERLRLHILKMRNTHPLLESMKMDIIRSFLTRNYMPIMAGGMLFLLAFYLIDTVMDMFDNKKE